MGGSSDNVTSPYFRHCLKRFTWLLLSIPHISVGLSLHDIPILLHLMGRFSTNSYWVLPFCRCIELSYTQSNLHRAELGAGRLLSAKNWRFSSLCSFRGWYPIYLCLVLWNTYFKLLCVQSYMYIYIYRELCVQAYIYIQNLDTILYIPSRAHGHNMVCFPIFGAMIINAPTGIYIPSIGTPN